MARLLTLRTLLLLLALLAAATRAAFEPYDGECAVELLDVCCQCGGCDGTGHSNANRAPVYDVSPLERVNQDERTGSALAVNARGTLVVAVSRRPENDYAEGAFDSSRGATNPNTTVHLIDVTQLGRVQHLVLAPPLAPQQRGHAVAVCDDVVAIGGAGELHVLVRTNTPPWSTAYVARDPSIGDANADFGWAVALERQEQLLVASDPSYHDDDGRVYVYLLYQETLLDSLRAPEPGALPPSPLLQGAQCRLGHALAVDGSTIVAAAPGCEAVAVAERDSDGKWYVAQVIVAPDEGDNNNNNNGTTLRRFGSAVALSGAWLVVGSLDGGAVEVYRRTRAADAATNTPSEWLHWQTLTAPAAAATQGGDARSFGYAVAVVADKRIAVGDPGVYTSLAAQGRLYTYEYSASKQRWLPCAAYVDDEGSLHTRYGSAVALAAEADYIVTGAPNKPGGAVYLINSGARADRCRGCDGEINSCTSNDVCGVCGGTNDTCRGCDGVPLSGVKNDYCGQCGGANTTCMAIDRIEGAGVTAPFALQARCGQPLDVVVTIEPDVAEARTAQWRIARFPAAEGSSVQFASATAAQVAGSRTRTLRFLSGLRRPQDAAFRDSFQLQATTSTGRVLTATVSVTLLDCVGCDGVDNSGTANDQCGVCGGDGRSCVDCAGVLYGSNVVDYCGVCSAPDNANRTCFSVVSRTAVDALVVACKHAATAPALAYLPSFAGDTVRWTLESSAATTDAGVSVDAVSGAITYRHAGSTNLQDVRIVVRATNSVGLSDTGGISVRVTLCDVDGCDGVYGSGKTLDRCNQCDGSDACVDCNDVAFGLAMLDACGVCGGDGSTCANAFALTPVPPAALSTGATAALWLALSGGVLLIIFVGLALAYFMLRTPSSGASSMRQTRYSAVDLLPRE